ncbi:hypothetical protein CFS9_42750 [Flavobacterium sp. CFS9]|uniref:Knr4/Smi1-like domain-containing protein n=1 Tax=Flavobacterium sp. CFS9 TaxID=3143118 RepID=A0AAT9H7W2_9FLAO
MKQELIDKIRLILSDNDLFAGESVDEEIIKSAENELNVKFDKDYVQFLSLFGGSYTGVPVYGFNNCEMLSEETVVDLTKDFRSNYLVDNRCELIQSSYVISVSGNGDPVFISPDDKVWIYYHDDDETEELNKSFEDLIEQNLMD